MTPVLWLMIFMMCFVTVYYLMSVGARAAQVIGVATSCAHLYVGYMLVEALGGHGPSLGYPQAACIVVVALGVCLLLYDLLTFYTGLGNDNTVHELALDSNEYLCNMFFVETLVFWVLSIPGLLARQFVNSR